MSNLKRALIIELLWTQSRCHVGFWCRYPLKQSSQPPNRNMKYYKSVEFLLIFGISSPSCTKVKPLY